MHLELMREEAREFPVIEEPLKYTSIKIWHCSYKSLMPLANFANVRSLEIATIPDDNIDFIGKLRELRSLHILHLPKVTSLRPIGRLNKLRKLYLEVLPSWSYSNKRTFVDSLRPLANLKEIEDIWLDSIVPTDGDLRILLRCPRLKTLHTLDDYPLEQFAWINGRRPKIKGRFLMPIMTLNECPCSKCGTPLVVLSGVLKYGTKCPQCHHKRVQQHLADWETCRARAERYRR